MMVYYLEDHQGHLMGEAHGKPVCRTHVRGNVFSFNMPWGDIERCCREAMECYAHAAGGSAHGADRKNVVVGVPHAEEDVAALISAQIVGGSKDLSLHIRGLTMRLPVLKGILEENLYVWSVKYIEEYAEQEEASALRALPR